ncbi:uncharacterized protein HKW66_Vig0194900 [Vigna angularis]|uniref:N-acetyltransferase domain-containing protein n=1 Tax=Phaseolus angularis TaxID=3914 RepID=A0A8T0KP38_PHAAN|nr:uncharacterized protein HKW66_Vig0194900 [Vigna angularis]
MMEGDTICAATTNIRDEGIDLTQISLRLISLDDLDYVMAWTTDEKGRNRHKSAELGYALGSRYWGKGIATHVVEQVVKAAFTEFPHLERLQALIFVENVGSQRVLLDKADFQRKGVLRMYAIIKGKRRDLASYSVLNNDCRS